MATGRESETTSIESHQSLLFGILLEKIILEELDMTHEYPQESLI